MTRVHRAAWVLPITRPLIRDGWVATEAGRIVGVGGLPDLPRGLSGWDCASAGQPPPSIVILPGLVNAHAHLELSWMRGQVPASGAMPEWASLLMALRRRAPVDPLPAIRQAIAEVVLSGTTLIGDVANTPASHVALSGSGISAMIFREMIGFTVDAAEEAIAAVQAQLDSWPASPDLRTTVVPHAPYSVSPALLAALGRHAPDRPLSIHLGESAAELEFLRTGAGPWRTVLESLGAWNPGWEVPGCGPVEYLERLGLLTDRLVAVHAVHLTDREISELAYARASIVTCPRSNQWTGAGVPPIARFYDSGARVALGTDSLASVNSLSIFDEMAAVRRLAAGVPAARILRSATLDGAGVLGFDDVGSIAAGKRASLLAVQVPATVDNVEEYLVSGVPAGAVGWLS